jgi:hypothetical protein
MPLWAVGKHAVSTEKLSEAVDQVKGLDKLKIHPGSVGGVVSGPGHGVEIIIEFGPEVEDDEVMPVSDPFDPADQLSAHDPQPGLLGHLSADGLGHRLARFDPAAGHGPSANRRRATSLDE